MEEIFLLTIVARAYWLCPSLLGFGELSEDETGDSQAVLLPQTVLLSVLQKRFNF